MAEYIEREALLEKLQTVEKAVFKNGYYNGQLHFEAVSGKDIVSAPAADVVPVSEVKLYHVVISENGVPEIKIQLGEKTLVLHTDPANVAPVVHGKWKKSRIPVPVYGGIEISCSSCGRIAAHEYNYCPHCGAKMDGE